MSKKVTSDYIYHLPHLNHNNYLNLLQIGWDKCKPGYSYINHRNIYIIHYIHSGKGKVELNNKIYSFAEKSCFIYRANEFLTMTADITDPWEFSFFAFNGTVSEELIEKTVFAQGKLYYSFNDRPSPHNVILDTLTVIKKTPLNEFTAQQFFFEFLSYFINSDEDTADNITFNNLDKKHLSLAKTYIKQNFEKPINISNLCTVVGINRSYLFKIFKKYTNKSIDQYLISVRINEARRLLHETDLKISTISNAVGYENYSAFYKMFKKEVGLGPYDYRNQIKSAL